MLPNVATHYPLVRDKGSTFTEKSALTKEVFVACSKIIMTQAVQIVKIKKSNLDIEKLVRNMLSY